MTRFARLGIALAVLMSGSGPSMAQQSARPYQLEPMNFDIWCQEVQHLPPRRCDKRLPQDDAAFQAYANSIENYEIEYLRRHESDRSIQQDFRHIDPAGTPPPQPGPPGG